jgi:hypothetical protein
MALFLFVFVVIGIFPVLLRAKGASVFMMLCVGKALMEIASDDVILLARYVLNSSLPIEEIAKVFLMVLPAVLALIITKKAAKKKFAYHIIPSIAAGLLGGYWAVDQVSISDAFRSSTTYSYVNANVAIILTVGVVSTLFLFMLERPKPVKPEDEAHKK